MSVSNEEVVHLFHDDCIPSLGPLVRYAFSGVPFLARATVSEFVDELGDWSWVKSFEFGVG